MARGAPTTSFILSLTFNQLEPIMKTIKALTISLTLAMGFAPGLAAASPFGCCFCVPSCDGWIVII